MNKNTYTASVIVFFIIITLISVLIVLGRFVTEFKLENTVSFYVVMLIGILIVAVNASIYQNILAPPLILSLIWLLPMYGASSVYDYQGIYSFFNKPVSMEVILICYNAILLYSFGALLVHRKVLNYNLLDIKNFTSSIRWNDKRMRKIIYFSFFLGIVAFSYAIALKGSIPIFSENIHEVRNNFRPSFWGNFFVFLVYTIVLSVIRISYVGFRKGYFTLVLGIICVLTITSSTARVDLIYATVISSVAYFIIQRNINPKFSFFKVVLKFGAVFILFIMLFQEVAKVRGINESSITYVNASPLTATYLGYGGPTAVKNFQRIIDEDIPYTATNGKFLFRSILWYVGFREEVNIGNYFSGPNTATWLYDYYIDFGILGVIIIPFFVGILSHFVYLKMLTSGEISWIIVYGFVLLNTILTINGDRFFGVSNTVFIMGFLILYIPYKYRFSLK